MKAAVLHEFEKPLSIDKVQIREPGEDEVLVRIKSSGICHSDLHVYHGREKGKMPLILGHECAGIVEQVGSKVHQSFKEGDRVLADYRITCGDCYYCSAGRSNLCETAYDFGFDVDGAFSEFIVLPSRQLFPLPSEISFEIGSIIGCAVVTAYHALQVGEMRPSDTVAVFGVGGVGYNILKFARAFGASKLVAVDIDDRKLARAQKLGALIINPTEVNPEKRIRAYPKNQALSRS
jgi:propanol-preferring alcohol dehydrogenase